MKILVENGQGRNLGTCATVRLPLTVLLICLLYAVMIISSAKTWSEPNFTERIAYETD